MMNIRGKVIIHYDVHINIQLIIKSLSLSHIYMCVCVRVSYLYHIFSRA